MHLKLLVLILFVSLYGCGGGSPTSSESTPADDPVLTQFSFLSTDNPTLGADILLLQEDNSTLMGRIPTNIPVTELVASFEFIGSSMKVGDVVQQSGSTANDFTDSVVYTVVKDDGDTQNYTVDLTKFTGLPIIYLKTDGSAAIESTEDYVNGHVSIDGGRNYENLAEVEMEIRGRGNTTWTQHPKKPFQMKLEDKAEFLGMPNDKKWLFLAEYSDKTMLRNTITFEMGYLSNLDWTPQSKFAEVYLNDEYNGTYNITQKVEESDNRVPLGDTGYLLELDQLDRLDPDDVYFTSAVTSEFLINIKEPNLEPDSAEHIYIRDLINEFENTLFGSSFLSVTDGYAKYIDVDSFVDWFLISEITKNADSRNFSSIFLNVMPGEKIKMGPLWDFDVSFGNIDFEDLPYAEGWWVKYHPWYGRLFQDPTFVEKVKTRFAYFRSNQDLILSKIDNYAEQLQWAQQENDSKWQTIGQYVWPNPVVFDSYQEEVDHLKAWYISRMTWLDGAFSGL